MRKFLSILQLFWSSFCSIDSQWLNISWPYHHPLAILQNFLIESIWITISCLRHVGIHILRCIRHVHENLLLISCVFTYSPSACLLPSFDLYKSFLRILVYIRSSPNIQIFFCIILSTCIHSWVLSRKLLHSSLLPWGTLPQRLSILLKSSCTLDLLSPIIRWNVHLCTIFGSNGYLIRNLWS